MKKIVLGILEVLGRSSLGIVICLIALDIVQSVLKYADDVTTIRVWLMIITIAVLYVEYLILFKGWSNKK